MSSIQDIIPCIQNLSNTVTVQLTYENIQACDELPVTSCRSPFIKKYHHFTYPRPGVVNCKYIKGQGEYKEELMKQVQPKGVFSQLYLFQFESFIHWLGNNSTNNNNGSALVGGTSSKDICSICEEDDDDDDEIRTWIQCDSCYQWVHCDCAGVNDSVIEDDFDVPFDCDECEKDKKGKK